MTWGHEIVRALFVAFGCVEIITNSSYLLKSDGMRMARKQHGELPPDVSESKLKVKVLCMLITGILFFCSGVTCYIMHTYLPVVVTVCAGLLAIYSIIEALYYKFWKTIGFSAVSITILISVFITSILA